MLRKTFSGFVCLLALAASASAAITYRTTGTWGAGKGAALTYAEADTNFYEIEVLKDDLASTSSGKGASLVKIPTAGGGSITVAQKLDWIDPREYGLVLDTSTAGAANRTALQNALDNAAGKPVLLPEGTVWLAGTLQLKTGHVLVGLGPGRSIIKETSANNDSPIEIVTGASAAQTDILLADFEIDGNGANQTVAGNYAALKLWNCQRVTVRNLYIHDMMCGGINVGYDTTGAKIPYDVLVEDVRIERTGLQLSPGSTSGISITAGENIRIVRPDIRDIRWLNGINVEPGSGDAYPTTDIEIVEPYIETTQAAAIQIKKTVGTEGPLFSGVHIRGGTLRDCTYGIYCDNSQPMSNVRIEGVTVIDWSTTGIVGPKGGLVKGCTLRDGAAKGIATHYDTTVEGNQVIRPGGRGIETYPRTRILNNHVIDPTGAGIYVVNYSDDCLVHGNTIDGDGVLMTYGIEEQVGAAGAYHRVSYRGNNIHGYATAPALIRSRRDTVDLFITSPKSVDLSGAAERVLLFQADRAYWLVDVDLVYTEASSADAGVTVGIGKSGADTHWYSRTTETGKSLWYRSSVLAGNSTDPAAVFTAQAIAEGDTIFLYSAGAKAGTGEIAAQLKLMDLR